jgi:hypothetical protein
VGIGNPSAVRQDPAAGSDNRGLLTGNSSADSAGFCAVEVFESQFRGSWRSLLFKEKKKNPVKIVKLSAL